MNTPIENTIALVTGSNRGIGRAIVEALVARGAAKVYAAARNPETLADLVAAHGDRIVPVALDVTDPDQIAAAASRASDTTILVNNAGTAANPDLFGDDLLGARAEFEVNYWGPLNLIRAFAPVFKTRGNGAIVNISSIAGLSNFPLFPTYSDSKAAVHSLTVGARFLLGQAGIHVMGVYPGPIDTDMAKDLEMPKETPAAVATSILDGLESGVEDIFPDAMAQGFSGPYAAGHKTLEHQIAEMLQSG